MALHLGSGEKLQINLNNVACSLNLFSVASILKGLLLLSSERYMLKDSNGLYLIAKESE